MGDSNSTSSSQCTTEYAELYMFESKGGFIVELLVLFYLLYGLSLITELYLLPCLQNLVTRYKLNDDIAGGLLAIGASIPEMSTNIISSFSEDPKMLDFGIGMIVGSGVYDFTICLAVATLFTVGDGKKSVLNLKTFSRDTLFYLMTIIIIIFCLRDMKITLYEALFIFSLWFVYIVFCLKVDLSEESGKRGVRKDKGREEEQGYMAKDEEEGSPEAKSLKSYNDLEINSAEEVDTNEESTIFESYYSQPKIKKEKPNIFISLFTRIGSWIEYSWELIFSFILPPQLPLAFTFIIITVFSFFCTKYILFIVDRLVCHTRVSHNFIGLVVMAWGGNIGDTISASIGNKTNKLQIATTSIFSSQVLNVQVCLALPWVLSILAHGQKDLIFHQTDMVESLMLVSLILLLSFVVLLLQGMKLSKKAGFCLMTIYITYVIFEFIAHENDKF